MRLFSRVGYWQLSADYGNRRPLGGQAEGRLEMLQETIHIVLCLFADTIGSAPSFKSIP